MRNLDNWNQANLHEPTRVFLQGKKISAVQHDFFKTPAWVCELGKASCRETFSWLGAVRSDNRSDWSSWVLCWFPTARHSNPVSGHEDCVFLNYEWASFREKVSIICLLHESIHILLIVMSCCRNIWPPFIRGSEMFTVCMYTGLQPAKKAQKIASIYCHSWSLLGRRRLIHLARWGSASIQLKSQTSNVWIL